MSVYVPERAAMICSTVLVFKLNATDRSDPPGWKDLARRILKELCIPILAICDTIILEYSHQYAVVPLSIRGDVLLLIGEYMTRKAGKPCIIKYRPLWGYSLRENCDDPNDADFIEGVAESNVDQCCV